MGSYPDTGKPVTVTTGQVMVTKYDYLSLSTATLLDRVDSSAWYGRRLLPAGTKLIPAVSSGQQIYCDQTMAYGAACLADSKSVGSFDLAYTVNVYGFLVNKDSIPPAPYRVADQSIRDGFKYELLYQGIDHGVVRIAYREYTDSIARPAFAQDLTYTLENGAPTHIKFRDVSMTIQRADNSVIDYIVDSGF